MARHRVFICYSHRDKKLFDELLVHLNPIENQGRLEVWTDQQIMAGDEWEPEIYRAIDRADAAVLLLSPDFLASDFVRDNEIPRLLGLRQERGLKVFPLFLRSAIPDLLSFPVAGGDPVVLTELQGLNTPQEPVAALSEAARDQALAAAARKVLEAVGTMDEPRLVPAKPRRELTAVLELRDGRVVRRYGQPPWYDLYASRGGRIPRRWAERPMDDVGRELFRLLLGDGDERAEVLGRAYDPESPDPLRHAFRIRIRTEDEELRTLPWAACRWRDYLLVDEGWTFELAAGDRPRPVEHLHTPCRALMVAAEPEGRPGLLADAHQKSLEGLLARAWKLPLKATLLHRARTPAELAAEFSSPPDLLYVYAHAGGRDGGLELLLVDDDGAETAVPFAEVAARLATRPPKVVVVNTIGDGPLAPALPGMPALIHLRHPEAERDARMAAASWWEAVLGRALDPVRAFCELPESVRRRGAVTTDYQEWRLDHSEYVPKVDRPRAHLDRRDQRRVARDAVEELVRSGKRRVTCLVAYGAEGNLVQHFAVQMLATLKERATDVARLEPHGIVFPAERGELTRGTIEELFREAMSLQPSDRLAAAFKPRRGGPRAKPVHFLDWGTFGDGHQEPLNVGQLETWLEFCRDDLEGACPRDARILAYLSLVSGEDRHPGLEGIFKELKLRHHAPHFDLVALPALGTVEAEDLLRFLEDGHNSSCPPAFVPDLSRRTAPRGKSARGS